MTEMIIGLLIGGIVSFSAALAMHKAIEWGKKENVVSGKENDLDA